MCIIKMFVGKNYPSIFVRNVLRLKKKLSTLSFFYYVDWNPLNSNKVVSTTDQELFRSIMIICTQILQHRKNIVNTKQCASDNKLRHNA